MAQGVADTAALESRESSYDTTRLLAAVDIVDRIRTQLHDAEGLRDDLIDDFVMELTRVREILEPLAALHPNDGSGEG